MKEATLHEGEENPLLQRLKDAKYILLDVDGTLVSTEPWYFQQKVKQTLESIYGPAWQTHIGSHAESLSTLETAADIEHLASTLFPDDTQHFFKVFNTLDSMDERMEATKLHADAALFLATLNALGRKVYLISNQGEELLQRSAELIQEQMSKQHPMASLFSFEHLIYPDIEDNAQPFLKPHPGMFMYVTNKFGLDPLHCIAVGDRMEDVQAAVGAHIGVPVYVTRDNSSNEHTIEGEYIGIPNLYDLGRMMNIMKE